MIKAVQTKIYDKMKRYLSNDFSINKYNGCVPDKRSECAVCAVVIPFSSSSSLTWAFYCFFEKKTDE